MKELTPGMVSISKLITIRELLFTVVYGAGNGIRTRDPNLGKVLKGDVSFLCSNADDFNCLYLELSREEGFMPFSLLFCLPTIQKLYSG